MRPLVLVLLLTSCVSARTESPRATIDAFLTALERGEVQIAELFTADATVFFPMHDRPLRANGREEIAAAFAALFGPGYRGGLPKPQDVRVQEVGESAVVTFQNANPNVTSRRTFVLRREAGRWRIVHLHGSNIRASS